MLRSWDTVSACGQKSRILGGKVASFSPVRLGMKRLPSLGEMSYLYGPRAHDFVRETKGDGWPRPVAIGRSVSLAFTETAARAHVLITLGAVDGGERLMMGGQHQHWTNTGCVWGGGRHGIIHVIQADTKMQLA